MAQIRFHRALGHKIFVHSTNRLTSRLSLEDIWSGWREASNHRSITDLSPDNYGTVNTVLHHQRWRIRERWKHFKIDQPLILINRKIVPVVQDPPASTLNPRGWHLDGWSTRTVLSIIWPHAPWTVWESPVTSAGAFILGPDISIPRCLNFFNSFSGTVSLCSIGSLNVVSIMPLLSPLKIQDLKFSITMFILLPGRRGIEFHSVLFFLQVSPTAILIRSNSAVSRRGAHGPFTLEFK